MDIKERIRRRASQVSGTMRSIDFFQTPIPGLNIEGKSGEGTLLGSMITIVLIIVIFLYGTTKFEILVNRVNPEITIAEEPLELED